MDKRYTVFVSSTYKDLAKTRDEIIKTLMRVRHIPLGMEAFNASNSSSWEIIKKTIDISDYYIVVVGVRYGSIHKSEKISYTEMEYNYASQSGIPCYIFIASDSARFPAGDRDSDPKSLKKLAEFKRRLMNDGRNIVEWDSTGDLTTKITAALAQAIADHPQPGWTRDLQATPEIATELARLNKRNADLESEISEMKKTLVSEPTLECVALDANEDGAHYFPVLSLAKIRAIEGLTKKPRVDEILANIVWSRKTGEAAAVHSLASAATLSGLLGIPYNVSKARIDRVINFLTTLEMDHQIYDWQFSLIGMPSVGMDSNGIPVSTTQVTGGNDLSKYKLFQQLEELDRDFSKNVERHKYNQQHRKLKFKVSNLSRIPIKDIKVLISYTDSKISLDNIDSNPNSLSITNDVLSPGESLNIDSFYYIVDDKMQYTSGDFDEFIRVRVTGSNLSEPIIYLYPVFLDVS